MPNASIVSQRFQFTKPKPIDLINRFYAAFGFILTISIHVACYKTASPHCSDTFDDLLGCAIAVVPIWGIVYGGWMARQTWPWCLLTLFSICSLIGLGFRVLGQTEMFVCFAFAQGLCVFWLLISGIKMGKWPNR
jgi:hypothetical protein